MKLRYLIPCFVAALTMFVSCSDDNDPTYLDEVRVSSSYVAIPQDGGSTTITVTATGDWTLESQRWIAGKDTTVAATPKWLKVNTVSGAAGQTDITFSADATLDGRTCELLLNCGGKTQRINVIQGLSTISNATCAEIIAGPDSKTYRATGTVKSIVNTTYGNWYLQDETGEVYIYGTLDAKGQTKNFLSLGLEVGDEVTVEGPKTTYNGTVELVDVTVVKINKSLIKVDSLSTTEALPLEGGDVTAFVTCKGNGISVEIPEDAKDWLFITAITGNTVTFRALPNAGGDRETTVTFKTTDGKKEYTSQVAIAQKGAIVAVSVGDFIKAAEDNTMYRITGVITDLYASDKQGKSFYITDYSGTVLIYRAEGFETSGAKVGDVVTVVGKRTSYKETPQMGTCTFEELTHAVTEVTIAEFLSKEDNPNVYYMVTGTLDEIANADYGNVYLKDGDQRLYVYGCYPGWGATGDARKYCIENEEIKVGDKLTVIGVKSTYKGTPQVANGVYFKHVPAN